MLKRLLAFLLVGACGSTAPAEPTLAAPPAPEVCASFTNSPRLRNVASLLEGQEGHDFWPNYAPEENTVVFLGAEGERGCAVVRSAGTSTTLELPAPLALPTPVYWFYMNVDPAVAAEPLRGFAAAMALGREDLTDVLQEKGIGRALLINIDTGTEALTSPETDAAFDGIEENLAFMVLHESVHLNLQYPVWFDQGDANGVWPSWDAQPDLATVLQDCYGLAESAQEAEWEALRSALREGESLDSFFAARDRRRSTRTTTIEDFRGASHSCREAEAIVELEEGGADFIAFRTAVTLGWVTRDEMLAYLDLRWRAAPHYAFGLAQLWLLQERGGLDAEALTTPESLRERLSR